ncbi:MAG TPA: radical SAM protein [Verrucomicrobiae bacterium]|nr:radical SAM protein [Verrucomicrobiae bacterium]
MGNIQQPTFDIEHPVAGVPYPLDAGSSMLNVRCFHSGRAALACERAAVAQAMLANCHFCEHHCGVNRLAAPGGRCHAGAGPRFFSAQVEVSDELELIPTFAIALSGCDLRCDFCITGAASWNPRAGENFNAGEMAAKAKAAMRNGARTVMVLGGEPTVHLPAALELVAALPNSARLVWKTNAHGSAQARELLEDLFDVWLADFKFGNDLCAQRLAGVADYGRVVRENLLWAKEHSELIVRHLLMPGHVECCWRPVAEWLAENLPAVKVNLRSGFWPAWHSARHTELRGTIAADETARAFEFARQAGLKLIN